MIAVDKRGRLGNQMFQYAFGLAAAQQLGTRHAYDARELERYFVLEPRLTRFTARLAAETFDRVRGFERRELEADDREDPDEFLASVTDYTLYGGHFYSASFFRPAAAAVRSAFRVRDNHVERFKARYESLLTSGYVCAHVRLTDFFTYRDNVTLPPDYYRRALNTLDDRPVIVVSDEPDRVRKAFVTDSRIRVEQNDEIVDFLLLKHATQLIVSNSSFAWWAAWLNDEPGLRVIAPQWWLGLHERREFPVKAIPEQWEQVEARRSGDGDWSPVS